MQDERKKVLLVNIRNEFIYNNTQLDGYPCISVTILTNFQILDYTPTFPFNPKHLADSNKICDHEVF